MGWRFRKSVRLGPVKVNISKGGIGASVGVKGARAGVGPRGAYRSVSIPGTGLHSVEYASDDDKREDQKQGGQPKESAAQVLQRTGCALTTLVWVGIPVVIIGALAFSMCFHK